METSSQPQKTVWLTNFCDSIRLFISIVMIQIVVLVYSLSFFQPNLFYLKKLSYLTLFSQFTGVLILLSLCKLRGFFHRFPVMPGVLFLSLWVLVICYSIASFLSWLDIRLLSEFAGEQGRDAHLFFKLALVSLILTLTLLRYFYIQDQWQTQVQELSEARLKSLQSKIKPHFLFNTLNSITSLISVDPEKAEEAVLNFSSLMRRTFVNKGQSITLSEEITFVRQYLSIEKLRLGERLQYNIHCDLKCEPLKIPVLSIQPLVENAIVHGIQNLPQGGELSLLAECDKNSLRITVENPFIPEQNTQVHGMALENIRQRLKLMYSGGAELRTDVKDNKYKVEIKIPL